MSERVERKRRGRSRRRVGWYWITAATAGTVIGFASTGGGIRTVYAVPERAALEAIYLGNWTQTVPTRQFDIQPGPMDVVIEAFRQATGLQVKLSREGIASLPSPGVRGTFSAEQALQQILLGTGVMYRLTGEQAVTLELEGLSETVNVRAEIPLVQPSSVRFTEPLRDIPQTITVIPKAVMEQQGATTLREVLRNVTGISIQAGEGGVPAGDNLSIRGFNARTDMFVDGVRDFGAYSRDPFSIEQVEVSKGPASSYVGRGSTGGSINLASKSPGLTPTRSITFAGGSSAYKRGTIDINQPIRSIKNAAFRFNGMLTDAETPGRNAVENRRWGLSPSLSFGLNTPTTTTFSYLHLDQDNVPDYGLPWVPNTNIPLAAYADAAPPVSFSNFYGLTTRDFEKTFTRLGTGEIRHDFSSSLSLRSVVRYGRTRRDSVIASPRFAGTTTTMLNRQLQSRDQRDAVISSQTTLISRVTTGAIEHALVAGMEFARETSENFARTGPAAPLADLFNPDPNQPYAGPITRTGASTKAIADTVAAYAGDTVRLSDHWQLSGSLRWDQFDLDYKSIATTGVASPFARTDRMLSGRTGLVYKPLETSSIYFGYGTSLNPSAEGFALTASTTDLKPEKSQSYEAGTKWDLYSNRLSVNAAYFRTEKDNARTPGINPGDPPTVLDGQQNVDGMELGLYGNITDRWQAFGSYTFMRSEIARSNNAAEVGKEFSNTPRHSFSMWSNYRFPWAVDLGSGVNYVGERTNSTTAVRTAPGYWQADIVAAYHVNERLTIRLNVTNLTNERYIDRIGGGHFVPGPGRMAMVTTDIRF